MLGIIIPLTPTQMLLQRQLITDHLKHALSSKTRPLLDDLHARGIFRTAAGHGPQKTTHRFSTTVLLELERSLDRIRLKNALEHPMRPDVSELQAQGA